MGLKHLSLFIVLLFGSSAFAQPSQVFRDLPNGWSVTLSNQRYYSPKMVCYEGVGVPVDVKATNSKADLKLRQDPVIIGALAVLNSNAK